MKRTARGFTLIEMMIVIVLIGILSAIAIPNYQSYLRRAVCEDAKATLVGAANVMERFRSQNNTYVGAILATSGYDQSPVDGAAQFNIVAENLTPTSYLLTATPVAVGRLTDRGTLTLTSAGLRGATDGATAPGLLTADVWNSGCRGL